MKGPSAESEDPENRPDILTVSSISGTTVTPSGFEEGYVFPFGCRKDSNPGDSYKNDKIQEIKFFRGPNGGCLVAKSEKQNWMYTHDLKQSTSTCRMARGAAALAVGGASMAGGYAQSSSRTRSRSEPGGRICPVSTSPTGTGTRQVGTWRPAMALGRPDAPSRTRRCSGLGRE